MRKTSRIIEGCKTGKSKVTVFLEDHKEITLETTSMVRRLCKNNKSNIGEINTYTHLNGNDSKRSTYRSKRFTSVIVVKTLIDKENIEVR